MSTLSRVQNPPTNTMALCQLGLKKIEKAFYAVIETIKSLVAGIFLLIPFVNLLASKLLNALDSRLITLEQSSTIPPLPDFPIEIPPLPNYPGYKIDSRHMAKIALQNENISEPDGPPVSLDDLLSTFDSVASEEAFQKNLCDDNGELICQSIEQLPTIRDRLEFMINNIKQRNLSGMPADEAEKQYHYQRLETLLKHFIVFLKKPSAPITSIQPLVSISKHEAGRYLTAAEQCYHDMKDLEGPNDFEKTIDSIYTNTRKDTLRQLISSEEGYPIKSDTWNQYAHKLGPVIGIPCSTLGYEYNGSKPLNQEKLLKKFINLYSVSIETSIKKYQSHDDNHFNNWIRQHIPQEFIKNAAKEIKENHERKLSEKKADLEEKQRKTFAVIEGWDTNRKELAKELIDMSRKRVSAIDTLIEKYKITFNSNPSKWKKVDKLKEQAEKLLAGENNDHEVFKTLNMNGADELKSFQDQIDIHLDACDELARFNTFGSTPLNKKNIQDAIYESYMNQHVLIKESSSKIKPEIALEYLTDLGILQKC